MSMLLKKPLLPATWLVLVSGILYGLLGYFGTQLLKENISIPTMLFWRFFIACLWIIFCALLQNKTISSFFQTTLNCEATNCTLKERFSASLALLMAGIYYSGSSVFYFYASKETGTGLAMVIFFAYPIIVALFFWLQDFSNLNFYSVLSLVILSIGLYLLQKNNLAPIKFTSLVLALSASLFYALYLLKSKAMIARQNTYSSDFFTLAVCFISSLVFLLVAMLTHSFSLPVSIKAWANIVGLGIIATAIPIQLMLAGLKAISSLKASILSALEPVVTLLVGIAALHEVVSIPQWGGVVTILLGTVIIQFARES